MEIRKLYGGAIEGALSTSFDDISGVREVPDHQEVFVDAISDASIIVELLAYESNVDDEDAIDYYFQELGSFNDSSKITVIEKGIMQGEQFMTHFDPSFPRMALVGHQRITKYRNRPDAGEDDVYIMLVLIRLLDVTTDLLISLNLPVSLNCSADGGYTCSVNSHGLSLADLVTEQNDVETGGSGTTAIPFSKIEQEPQSGVSKRNLATTMGTATAPAASMHMKDKTPPTTSTGNCEQSPLAQDSLTPPVTVFATAGVADLNADDSIVSITEPAVMSAPAAAAAATHTGSETKLHSTTGSSAPVIGEIELEKSFRQSMQAFRMFVNSLKLNDKSLFVDG